ncbi:MAG: FAD-dependent monooxygenase [Rhodobacter sp.]|nr:FAD-dependent monooxygenase [Paracoccaceae bacterium]MCC0078128.1 FAD-dependent monooxygenase [Rhodobacter sp.]
MKINVIGGGPSGLYFAYLARKRLGDVEVNVFERNAPDATFGFGVVLADAGLLRLEAADAESFRRIQRITKHLSNQDIVLNGQAVTIHGPDYGGAVERLELLRVLQGLCAEAGVTVIHNADITDPATVEDADLVVGADGANSTLRERYAGAFGTEKGLLSNAFAWYGARMTHDRPTLSFRDAPGGAFVAHYYPYTSTMCTVVMECDRGAWQGCGFDAMNDDQRMAFSQQLFAQDLKGQPLVSNKSEWRNFVPIRNANWTHGHRVLIGDALRRAHFSIGSGTRIAMEDAIALIDALALQQGDVARALPQYVTTRRDTDRLTEAARQSYMWYEDMARHMAAARSPRDFAFGYLTRTSRVDADRVASLYPRFMADYRAEQAGAA